MSRAYLVSSPNNEPDDIFYFSSLKSKSKSTIAQIRMCRKQFISKTPLRIPSNLSLFKASEYPKLYTESSKKHQIQTERLLKKQCESASPHHNPSKSTMLLRKTSRSSKLYSLENRTAKIINEVLHIPGCNFCAHKINNEGSYEGLMNITRLKTFRVQNDFKEHFQEKIVPRAKLFLPSSSRFHRS